MPVYKEKAGVRVEDSWFLAKFWQRYMQQILKIEQSGIDVVNIDYENLIQDPCNVTDSILQGLGYSTGNKVVGNYVLSEKEISSKHTNVLKPALSQRLDAWKTEMCLEDGVIVEYLTVSNMKPKYFTAKVSKFKFYSLVIRGLMRHWMFNLIRMKDKVISKT
jgi:hypothetical protein